MIVPPLPPCAPRPRPLNRMKTRSSSSQPSWNHFLCALRHSPLPNALARHDPHLPCLAYPSILPRVPSCLPPGLTPPPPMLHWRTARLPYILPAHVRRPVSCFACPSVCLFFASPSFSPPSAQPATLHTAPDRCLAKPGPPSNAWRGALAARRRHVSRRPALSHTTRRVVPLSGAPCFLIHSTCSPLPYLLILPCKPLALFLLVGGGRLSRAARGGVRPCALLHRPAAVYVRAMLRASELDAWRAAGGARRACARVRPALRPAG